LLYLHRKDTFVIVYFALVSFSLLTDPSANRTIHSARSHEKTKRGRVVILEEAERKPTLGRKLNRLGGASLASSGGDDVAVAGLDGNIAEVFSDGWCVAPGGRLAGDRAQLTAAKASRSRESVVGSGQILLLREEEDNGALLSGILGWDVEVEDRACG
jgi:hypothetical protein